MSSIASIKEGTSLSHHSMLNMTSIPSYTDHISKLPRRHPRCYQQRLSLKIRSSNAYRESPWSGSRRFHQDSRALSCARGCRPLLTRTWRKRRRRIKLKQYQHQLVMLFASRRTMVRHIASKRIRQKRRRRARAQLPLHQLAMLMMKTYIYPHCIPYAGRVMDTTKTWPPLLQVKIARHRHQQRRHHNQASCRTRHALATATLRCHKCWDPGVRRTVGSKCQQQSRTPPQRLVQYSNGLSAPLYTCHTRIVSRPDKSLCFQAMKDRSVMSVTIPSYYNRSSGKFKPYTLLRHPVCSSADS